MAPATHLTAGALEAKDWEIRSYSFLPFLVYLPVTYVATGFPPIPHFPPGLLTVSFLGEPCEILLNMLALPIVSIQPCQECVTHKLR